jgi:predicted DsbA family dithiol-disulfide isomerase
LAKEQRWDTEKFSICMDAEETIRRVRNDIEAAEVANVEGTPYLFINGRRVTYWDSPEFIRAVIEEELNLQ